MPFFRYTAALFGVLLAICLSSPAYSQRPIAFDHVVVDPAGPRDPWGKAVGDIDGDGAPDLLVGGNISGGLVWYQNPSWTSHVISDLPGFRTDLDLADVDRDSLPDVVSLGTDSSGRPWLVWFKNPGLDSVQWAPFTIDTVLLHDIEVADLNGDSQIDIACRDQEVFGSGHGDTLYFFFQMAPDAWSKVTVPCTNGEGLKIADINRDSRPDIVIQGTWFENTGIDTTWIPHEYSATYTHRSVEIDVADMDNDSLLDIVLAPSEPVGGTYRISWFKAPPDPGQPSWSEHIVEDGVETVHHSVGVADFDNNGTMDIASAKMHTGSTLPEVKVFLNGGQGATWTKRVIATTGSHGMRIVDIDRNGSKDLFGANWKGEKSELWLNQPDTLTFSLLVADDAGAAQSLQFGLGRYATDSLDRHLGERELSYLPQPGQFDARFVGVPSGDVLGRGTWRDFRRGDSATVGLRLHQLNWQVRAGGTMTLSTDLPPQVSIRLHNGDLGPAVDTVLFGRSSLTFVDPGGPATLLLTMTYVLSKPPPPALEAPENGVQAVEAEPTVLWKSVDFCTAYHVQVWSPGSPSEPVVVDTVVADTILQLPILDSLTTYWWRVSGRNAAGEGEFSIPWGFQTKEFLADPRTLGLWRMDEVEGKDVLDLTLHDNDGRAVGTRVVEARLGNAREFNGQNEYIDLPESPSLLQPGRKFTAEAWVYLRSYALPGSRGTIISTGNQRDYEFSIGADGRLFGHFYLAGGPDSVVGTKVLPLAKWVHVALTYDGSLAQLYLNGVLDTSRSLSGVVGRSPEEEDILLGAARDKEFLSGFFHGILDEVRILKVARSPGEFRLQLPPKNLDASGGPGRVDLTWQNGGGGAPLLHYRIYRGADSALTVPIDSTEAPWYSDTTAIPFQTYFYRITGVDSSGFEGLPSHASKSASVLALPSLQSPADGQARVSIPVTFSWSLVRFATSYNIQVLADSLSSELLADSTVADTALVLGAFFQRGMTYSWRVRALQPSAEGGWSGSRSFTTLVPPPARSDLLLPPDQSTVGPDSVRCVWTASMPAVERYWFELAADSLFHVSTIDSLLTDTLIVLRGLTHPGVYWWRVRSYNAAGWGQLSEVQTFALTVAGLTLGDEKPTEFRLDQNYPNPFNPSTTIRYGLPTRSYVTVSIFNTLGQKVATLLEGEQEAGYHDLRFEASELSSGMYLYRLTAGDFVQTRKLLLVR